MRKIALSLVIFLFLSGLSYAAIIDSSNITAYGTLYPAGWYTTGGYTLGGPANTIDDNMNTGWRGTDDIQIGDINYLAYIFSQTYSISRIDFYENYPPTNAYNMGELDIQISQDSTDGLDGSWTTIEHIAGDFNPPSGDFSRTVNIESTNGVRLFMTYEGRAAHGGTPTFLLSEIDFDGESVAPIPEPTTVSLLGLGLLGLVFKKKKS